MKITYETTECSRCGGEGRLVAFSHVYGGQCFKCDGHGNMLTAKGRAAKKRVDAVKKELCVATASSLKAGDQVIFSGRRRTITSITTKLGRGAGSSNDPYTHEPVRVDLGVTVIRTKSQSLQGPAHMAVEIPWTTEALKVAAKAVSRMSGATVVE